MSQLMSHHFKAALILSFILIGASARLLPLAFADDGQWIKYPSNPILKPTAGGWDADFTTIPRVLFDGRIYRMWYVGGRSGVTGIGYANSTDGITWRKYNDPVLLPGPQESWDSSQVGLGSVIWNGTLFLMWYSGSSPVTYVNGAVGMAMSTDGISWIKYPGNPVLKPSTIDQRYIASPFVIKLLQTYNMWYTGKGAVDLQSSQISRILYATSFDGINWTKWPSPVLIPTGTNSWDSGSVFSPAVLYDGTNFGIWYSGLNQSYLNPGIGFGTSPDGATWTKSSMNPILQPGGPGSWDSAGVEQPSIATVNGYMLYYDGFSNGVWGIGLARAPQGFAVPEFPTPVSSLLLGVMMCVAIFLANSRKIRI
jgi:predicted GH43/DUF377 family glycosyl hydrolase